MAGIDASVPLLVEQTHERLLEQEPLTVGDMLYTSAPRHPTGCGLWSFPPYDTPCIHVGPVVRCGCTISGGRCGP